jgi:metal-dependent amidase/aminoacylase/carboxypeptidase family protein
MSDLLRDADTIATEESLRWHLQLEKDLVEPFRATENTPELVDKLNDIFTHRRKVTVANRPFRWSEDFAEYLSLIPGAFFGLGSGENQPELHHPDFDFPDEIIEDGAKCFELIMNNIDL